MKPGYYWFLTKLNGWQPVHINDAGHIRMIGVQHPVADATGRCSDIEHRIGPRLELPPDLLCARCHGSGKEPTPC